MKTHPKYIMGPLIFGGLIISLFLSILIYHIRTASRPIKVANPHTTAGHTLKADESYGLATLIKKFFPR